MEQWRADVFRKVQLDTREAVVLIGGKDNFFQFDRPMEGEPFEVLFDRPVEVNFVQGDFLTEEWELAGLKGDVRR